MDWEKSLTVEISTGEIELPEEPVDEELQEAITRDEEIEAGEIEEQLNYEHDAKFGMI